MTNCTIECVGIGLTSCLGGREVSAYSMEEEGTGTTGDIRDTLAKRVSDSSGNNTLGKPIGSVVLA